jgi:hypothetical protein
MYVDRARGLTRPDVVGLGQRLRAVRDLGFILPPSIRYMYILFCVSIDTYIRAWSGESRDGAAEFLAPLGAIDTSFDNTPSL